MGSAVGGSHERSIKACVVVGPESVGCLPVVQHQGSGNHRGVRVLR